MARKRKLTDVWFFTTDAIELNPLPRIGELPLLEVAAKKDHAWHLLWIPEDFSHFVA
jgi:hypothetical protein